MDHAIALETQGLRAGPNEFPKVSDALLRKLDVPVPPEPDAEEEPSSRRVPATLPPVAIDRWAKRTSVFEQMLSRAFAVF